MFKKKRIYGYLGDCDPLLNARATSRCGQLVVPCGDTGSGTGGEPTPVPTFEVGTPVGVGVTSGRTPISLDCQVLDPTRYVVVSVTSLTTTRWIEVSLISASMTNTVVTVGATQVLNTAGNWRNVSVVALTANSFVVFMHTDTGAPLKVYGMVCTISGGVITAGSPVFLADLQTGGGNPSVRVKAIKLRDDATNSRTLLAYGAVGAAPYGRVAIVTVDGTNLILGTPTIVPTGAFRFDDFYLCDAHYENLYRVSHLNSAGRPVNTSVFVYPDYTISVSGSSIDLGGFDDLMRVTPAEGSDFINASQFGVGGGRIVLTDFTGSTIKVVTSTQSTSLHSSLDVAYVSGGRVFYFYGRSVASSIFGVEMYHYSGSTGSLVYSNTIELLDMAADTLRTSSRGLSSTKTAAAYIGTLPSSAIGIRTVVLEAGQ